MLDELHEGLQLLRLQACPHQLFQFSEISQRLEDRKLIPAAEIRVVARRHLKQLVEALEQTPLSDERRDDVVDDPEVEMVSRDADAECPIGVAVSRPAWLSNRMIE